MDAAFEIPSAKTLQINHNQTPTQLCKPRKNDVIGSPKLVHKLSSNQSSRKVRHIESDPTPIQNKNVVLNKEDHKKNLRIQNSVNKQNINEFFRFKSPQPTPQNYDVLNLKKSKLCCNHPPNHQNSNSFDLNVFHKNSQQLANKFKKFRKSDQTPHEQSKNSQACFDNLNTNSLKIRVPSFPQKIQYGSKTPKIQYVQSVSDYGWGDDKTSPSTPHSMTDMSSPTTGKFTFTWSEAESRIRSKTLSYQDENKKQIRLEDFEFIKELGKGKYGVVNMVRHKKTGLLCALKTLNKSLIRQQKVVEQVVRQIKIQTILNHPNIIKLYGFFHSFNNVYLVMELSTQGQLYNLFLKKKKFSQKEVAAIMKQLCEAVRYMQEFKIMHRDIKPENIVIEKGFLKLCDFGWAVSTENKLRKTFCGTPLYISPEVLKGECYDEMSDIWALGILTYEMLVGELPFRIEVESQLRKIVQDDVVFPSDCNASSKAKDFVLKILKKNPKERLRIECLVTHPFIHQSDGQIYL